MKSHHNDTGKQQQSGRPRMSASADAPIPEWLIPYGSNITHAAKSHPSVKELAGHLSGQSGDDARFAAEGIGLCGQVADRVARVRHLSLFLVPELVHTDNAISIAGRLAGQAEAVYIVSRRTMESIGRMDGCQGMMLLAGFPETALETALTRNDAVVAVLDGLETPGNIGTIFRTCDGAGVDAVIYCNRRARTNHPELVKASMGAVLDIPFRDAGDVPACAEWLAALGFSLVLADPHGTVLEEGVRPSFAGERLAIVIGNERYGIHPDWQSRTPHAVAIPMRGRCDSLNAGVAASLMLYKFCGFRTSG